MQKGRPSRRVSAAFSLVLAGAIGAGPATRPGPSPDPQPLPAGALRRLGELRFLVDGSARGLVALSPDGRHAAVADAGGASVWDVVTGERTREKIAHGALSRFAHREWNVPDFRIASCGFRIATDRPPR